MVENIILLCLFYYSNDTAALKNSQFILPGKLQYQMTKKP